MKIVLALLAIGSIPVAAQVSDPGPHSSAQYSTLRGVAVDSVRGGLLKGASVGVLGPSRMGITDSLGRFFIDSIPPGEYTVALFDSFLDSLSISVVSPPRRFSAGDTVELVLAIPSQPTIVAATCGSLPTEKESAALFGRVFRAADGAPVVAADIRFGWLDVTIDRETGVQTTPHLRVARSDSTGRFRICRLPAGVIAELSASLGEDSTSAVPIAYGDAHIGIVNLFLPGHSAARGVGAPVQGTVVDADGKPIEHALVSISSNPAATTTAANGTFEIAARRLGTQALLVRRMGHEPVETVVNVMLQPSAPMAIRLDRFVPILESVVIRARLSAALEEVGFARRKRFGLGRYWERAELRDISSLENFMETIPVLRRQNDLPRATISTLSAPTSPVGLGPGSAGRAASRAPRSEVPGLGTRCPRTFLDGVEVRGGAGGFVMPNELAAIEVYSAIMTPAEFRGFDNCPTIIIWTDRRLRRGY